MGDFPGGAVDKTPHPQCRGPGFDLVQKMAKIPLPKAWERYTFTTSNDLHFDSTLASCLLLKSGF